MLKKVVQAHGFLLTEEPLYNEYMSINSVSAAAERVQMAMLLARSVRRRRQELGLSVKRSAELAGMATSDWYALEAGWVPSQESGLVDAIAGTLESGHMQTSFIAEVSRYNQEVLFSNLPPLAS